MHTQVKFVKLVSLFLIYVHMNTPITLLQNPPVYQINYIVY